MGRYLRLRAGTVDLLRGELERDGRAVRLSTRELDLLTYLALRAGRSVSREELLTEVWEHHPDSLSRAVDKTMTRLRSKLELDPAHPDHLVTVFGEGYRFVPRPDTAELPLPPAACPTNLPAAIDTFLGRADLLAAIEAAYAGGRRLVTLLGLGGIGKTRAAQEFARARLAEDDGPSGGVWFCDLAAVSTPAGLVRTVAAALGLDLAPGDPDAVDRLGRVLASRGELLLLLDNLDDVAGEAGGPLVRWMRAAPELRILGTSRTRLGAPGETVLEVGPLEGDAAAALFIDRAAAVRGGLGPRTIAPGARAATASGGQPAVDDGAVSELVGRLDGIPLAIELAASRAAVARPQELLDDLDSVLDLDGPAGAPERHSSLRATLTASWWRLTERQRGHVAACALFRGGFDLAAAEAVLGVGGRTATQRVLGELRDRSWLRATIADGALGWRFSLYPVVARFVATVAEAPADAVERHGRHYLDLAEQLLPASRRRGGERARRRLRGERANLLEVHRRSLDTAPARAARAVLAIDPVNVARAPTSGDLWRLRSAVEQADKAGDGPLRQRARVALATALWRRGNRDEADAVLEQADLDADPVGAAEILNRLAVHRMYTGHPGVAQSLMERSLGLVSGRDAYAEAGTVGQIGILLDRIGRPLDALEHHERALALLEPTGDLVRLGRVLNNLGISYLHLADHAAAQRYLERALAARRDVGDRSGEAITMGNLASVLAELGRPEEAETCLRSAIAMARATGAILYAGMYTANLGILCLDQGRHAEAGEYLEEARAIAVRLELPRSETVAVTNLAILGWLRGEHVTVERAWARLDAVFAEGGVGVMEHESAVFRAAWLADRGRPEAAAAVLEVARAALGPGGRSEGGLLTAEAWVALGRSRAAGEGVAGRHRAEAAALLERAFAVTGPGRLGPLNRVFGRRLREVLEAGPGVPSPSA